jgi:hypothetical protein
MLCYEFQRQVVVEIRESHAGRLSVHKIQNKVDYYGQDDTDDQEGDYGKIKGKVVFLDEYIARQFTEKRYMLAEDHQQSDHDDDRADDKQYFSETFHGHRLILN